MRALMKHSVSQRSGKTSSIDPSTLEKCLLKFASTKKEAVLEVLKPYKLHMLDKGPATKLTFTAIDALKTFKEMVTMRQIEAAIAKMYRAKTIRGFCHTYNGQEAIAVGIGQQMRKVDVCVIGYRCHAWFYILGGTVLQVLAELAGRKAGNNRGKGGSMHLYTRQMYGGHGIVGAQCPIGVGVSLANKYRGNGGVAFSVYGDGASNQGQLYEALNIARLWGLPHVSLLEDNQYGLGTSVERASALSEAYRRINFVPGIWVNGMDVVATRAAAKFCIDHCSSGKGPILIQMDTYRYTGHSMSDPGTSYRNRDEIEQVRQKRDPIEKFKNTIIKASLVTEGQLEEIQASVKKDIAAATKEALQSPEIGKEEIAADVYCKSLETHIRNTVPDKPLKHITISEHQRIR